MRRKSHVRFGERDGENRIEQSMYGVSVPTLRDPTPSPEDVLVTREIVQAGKLLDVQVLDHLVIGHGCFVSMRERGLGFAE
ncbi:MAG TPA: JAB domain-containing protein [Edaphobacter sp.]|nr:JAB domain-containing protein [Edaphobacter sp.]